MHWPPSFLDSFSQTSRNLKIRLLEFQRISISHCTAHIAYCTSRTNASTKIEQDRQKVGTSEANRIHSTRIQSMSVERRNFHSRDCPLLFDLVPTFQRCRADTARLKSTVEPPKQVQSKSVYFWLCTVSSAVCISYSC